MTCAMLCCTREVTETVRVTSRTISPTDEQIIVYTQDVPVCESCAEKLRATEVRDGPDRAIRGRRRPVRRADVDGLGVVQDGGKEDEEVTKVDKSLFTTVQRRFKVWFLSVTVTFGTAWQLKQAEDLVQHDGLSEMQAVAAVNRIMRGTQVLLDRI